MAMTYTNHVKLGKPGVADRHWNVPINTNADALDALSPVGGLCVSPSEIPSASLVVQVAPGRFQKRDGTIGSFGGAAAVTLPADKTCSLHLTDAAVLIVSTDGYPATAHVPLATVVTDETSVESVTDDRLVCAVVGINARDCLSLDGGALADGAVVNSGTTTGAKIGGAADQKLGFWGAAPVVRPGEYSSAYATSTRNLAAYSPAAASTSYSGIAGGAGGAPYAQATDLEALRSAYENLRKLSENTAQLLNAVVADLKSMGLLG